MDNDAIELHNKIATVIAGYWKDSKRAANERFSTICASLLNILSNTFIHQVDEKEEKKIEMFCDVLDETRKVFMLKIAAEKKPKL